MATKQLVKENKISEFDGGKNALEMLNSKGIFSISDLENYINVNNKNSKEAKKFNALKNEMKDRGWKARKLEDYVDFLELTRVNKKVDFVANEDGEVLQNYNKVNDDLRKTEKNLGKLQNKYNDLSAKYQKSQNDVELLGAAYVVEQAKNEDLKAEFESYKQETEDIRNQNVVLQESYVSERNKELAEENKNLTESYVNEKNKAKTYKNFTVASAVLTLGLVIALIITLATGAQKVKDVKQNAQDEKDKITERYEAEKSALLTQIENVKKQNEADVKNVLSDVIKSFGVTEDVLQLNTNGTSIITFGKQYEAKLSDKGVKNFKNAQSDELITMDYFASVDDAKNFLEGYVKVFVPAKIDSIQEKIDYLNNKLNSNKVTSEQEKADLLDQIDELNDTIQDLRENIEKTEEEHDEEILAKNKEIENVEKALQEVEIEKAVIESQLKTTKEELQDVINNGVNTDKEVQKLQSKIEDLEEELDNKEIEYNAIKKSNEDLKDEVVELLEKSEAKTAEINNLKETIDGLEDKVADLEYALNNQNVSTNVPSQDKVDENNNQQVGDSNSAEDSTAGEKENGSTGYQPGYGGR